MENVSVITTEDLLHDIVRLDAEECDYLTSDNLDEDRFTLEMNEPLSCAVCTSGSS